MLRMLLRTNAKIQVSFLYLFTNWHIKCHTVVTSVAISFQRWPNPKPSQVLIARERTIIGSVSYRYGYWGILGVSYGIVWATVVSAGRYTRIMQTGSTVDRIALHTMIKGRSSDPSPARRACTRVCCFMVHRYGRGLEGREAEGDCNLIPASLVTQRPRSTGLGHYHAALPPPAGSDNNSQLSITITFLQVNQS